MIKFIFLIMTCSQLLYSESSIQIKVLNPSLSEANITYTEINDSKIKVVILDKENQPIEDLTKKDFALLCNGNPTEIISFTPLSETSSATYNVILCLDNSSSMRPYSDDLLMILDTLINSFSKSANISAVFFDEKITKEARFYYDKEPLKIRFNSYNTNRKDLVKLCNRSYSASNLTNKTYLNDQLFVAFQNAGKLFNEKEDVFFIVLSDGEDNASETNFDLVKSEYKNGKIYSIDFAKINRRENYLQALSTISKGEYFKAENAVELARYFKKIASKIIFSGYEITYKELFPPKVIETEPYYLENEKVKLVKHLDIEDVKSKEFFPLLNYVFFDKNSYEISSKYIKINNNEINKFDEKSLPPDQLKVYHNCLNIIGRRITEFADSKINLVGCNDNEGPERNNKKLSINRAEAVKEYLVTTWGIDPQRIVTKSCNLPQKPSTTKNIYGQEENRRVEIHSDEFRILEPVDIISDSKISKPAYLQIPLKYKCSAPIKYWSLNISQNSTNVFSIDGKDLPPAIIPWNIYETLKEKDLDSSDFIFTIKLKDENGKESENTIKRIPITYISTQKKKAEQMEDKIVEKLSLVLFDFNSSTLSKRNQEILLMAQDAITSSSTLKMNGFTDSLGTETGNMKLSQQRATNSLKELIKLLKPETQNYSSEGYGESIPLYDNGTPEGRFYNRTCQLIIETPIKNR